MVCRDTCLDPVPPQMSAPNIYPEGLPVPDARPRPTDTFVSGTGDYITYNGDFVTYNGANVYEVT